MDTSASVRVFGHWYTQPHQDNLWRYMDAGGLRACVVWHRRGGKDDVALRWTCKAAHKRVGNYWHMLPQAEQARKAIWEAINPHTGKRRIDEAFPPALRRRTRNNEMMIELKCGSIWQVVGSDNYNALVGSPPIGIVFSEWSLADPQAWAYMRPILRENGGWAVFIYTPRGRNHGWTLLESARQQPGWFHEVVPATVSGVFTPEQLTDELRELQSEFGRDHGEAKFEQEYLCSFDAANIGAVYARWIRSAESEGRITSVPHDPDLEVFTSWDLGWSDATAIWFYQVLRGELRFIDFYANSQKPADYYAQVVHGELEGHEHRKAYRYRVHHGPHDAANKVLAAGGRSTGDLLADEGISLQVWPAVAQHAQIEAARATLEASWFDAGRCAEGLHALRSYHFPWDDKLMRLKDEPLHDWSSHPADAYEIAAQAWRPQRHPQDKPKPRFLHEVTADEVFFPKHKDPFRRERI